MNNMKAIGNDDVPGDLFKLLGDDGLRIKQQINNIHEKGQWPKGFIEVTMTALKKNPKATKHSLIIHTAKTKLRCTWRSSIWTQKSKTN